MGNRSKQALKIMIVEDEEDIMNLYTDYLSRRDIMLLAAILEEMTLRKILNGIYLTSI